MRRRHRAETEKATIVGKMWRTFPKTTLFLAENRRVFLACEYMSSFEMKC